MNNCYNYEKKYWYSLYEALCQEFDNMGMTLTDIPYYDDYENLMNFGDFVFDLGLQPPSKLASYNSEWTNADYINDLFINFVNRYLNEYVFYLDKEYNAVDLYNSADGRKEIQKFMGKLMNLMVYTYDKYSMLLKAYSDEKDNLLKKLKRTTSGEVDNTGTQRTAGSNGNLHKENDTPQGSGDFSGDTHVSFLTKDDGTSDTTRTDNLKMESSGSEEWDNEPIIDRLKKVEDSFKNVMKDWVNEFAILFVEGGNLHEI